MTSEFCTVTMFAIVDTQVMFYTGSVCKKVQDHSSYRDRANRHVLILSSTHQ
jgi:hypothetical protein